MAGAEYTRGPAADRAPAPVRAPAVVVVGAASRDIAATDPRGWRLGGGVAYGALTLARLGLATAALVGVDEAAAGASELDLLRLAGVDLQLVPLAHGPVFDNVERLGGRIQTCLDAGSPLPAAALPAAWAGSPGWMLVPVAGEIDDGWAAVPPATARVTLGWQGLLRLLEPGRQVERRAPQPSALLRRAEIVGVSRHDLDHRLSLAALQAMLDPGAQLVVTAGHDGGILFRGGGPGRVPRLSTYQALPSRGEVDPTGAGDTFLAALVAARLAAGAAPGDPIDGRQLRVAAAAASLVVEGIGLKGVPDLAAVACRLAGPS